MVLFIQSSYVDVERKKTREVHTSHRGSRRGVENMNGTDVDPAVCGNPPRREPHRAELHHGVDGSSRESRHRRAPAPVPVPVPVPVPAAAARQGRPHSHAYSSDLKGFRPRHARGSIRSAAIGGEREARPLLKRCLEFEARGKTLVKMCNRRRAPRRRRSPPPTSRAQTCAIPRIPVPQGGVLRTYARHGAFFWRVQLICRLLT